VIIFRPRTKPCLGDRVHVMAEEVPQIHQQSAKIEQPAARLEIDQEVDVTRFCRVPARNRTEDPDPPGAASMRHLKDLTATRPQVGQHRDGHARDTTPEDAS